MKKILWSLLLIPALLLTGCGGGVGTQELTAMTFERGNASVWGDQLYITITEKSITTLRYIPEGASQLQSLEQLPLKPEQWQALTEVLEQQEREQEKPKLLEKLFPRQDGGDYRRLTLHYGDREVTYRLPAGTQPLERLLEQLVAEVIQP